MPELRDALRAHRPLYATEDSYVFVDAKSGKPINQSEWPKDHWRRALTATKVRPRKFYSTRATFISVPLTKGANLKFIGQYCGTSVAMIERSYGRFLPDGDDHQLALLAGADSGNGKAPPQRTPKNRDPGGRVSVLRRKTQAE